MKFYQYKNFDTILLIILVILLYIQYKTTYNKIETMKNREGYITKLRKYSRKNILRPLRFNRENIQTYYNSINRKLSHFLG
jgi:hypothetical protein